MKALIVAASLLFTYAYAAEDVIRVDIGGATGYGNKTGNHKVSTNEELQKRVLQLERAVDQLQRRVFELQNVGRPVAARVDVNTNSGDSWVCTISAMGDRYTGTGGSKAVAMARATESCRSGQGGDGFFCKDPNCTQ